jgi:hypothetical protein
MAVDPFSAGLIANLAKLVVDVARKTTGYVKWDKAIAQKWYNATGQYVERYKQRHCQLQVLGMAKPMALEDVYTAVQLLDTEEIRYFQNLQGLEDLYRQAGNRELRWNSRGKQLGVTVANQEQYLMVLGGPGIGKSTFLRKMGLEALKTVTGAYQHSKIPVLLELKRFNSDQAHIETLVVEEFQACGFPNAEAFATAALAQGKLLVLLDGLDEVPTANLDGVIQQIGDFVSRYPQNRFITSCRMAAYHGFFKGFTEVAIAEFDDVQIEQFIHNYFCSELDQAQNTAQDCWQLLQEDSNAPAKELAQTPLLLTYLCLVYNASQTFPPKRSLLYGEALDILLQKWAAEKRIKRDPIYQGLHVGLEKAMLAAIAFPSFAQNQLFLEEQQLLALITEFLADTLDAPKTLDASQVLTAIEVQQGILVKRAQNTYSFSHLTLQEYLTAFRIQDQGQTDWLLENHLTDDRWREIFLLVTGLLGGQADGFLAKMEKQAQGYINTPELINLFEYLEWFCQKPHDKFTPLQRRLGAAKYNIATAAKAATATATATANTAAKVTNIAVKITNITVNAAINVAVNAAANASANAANAAYLANANAAIAVVTRADANANVAAKAVEAMRSSSDHPEIFYFQENFDLNQFRAQADYLANHVPAQNASQQEWDKYAQGYLDLFHSMFDTSRGIFSLSEEEFRALEKYLKVVKLILDCKDAAVRISRTAWETLETRLLTVPDHKKQFPKPKQQQ